MDLIPKPDQVAAAAGNVAHSMLYGGLADLRPMARTLVDAGPRHQVHAYRPTIAQTGDPVLLAAPLAAPALCYDLRRGCSLVEHLLDAGRPTYLVEQGELSFEDRALGMQQWALDVVPAAIRAASAHAGGRPVHVVGWSLGGIFSLLAAADQPDLPIASLSVLAAPVDVSLVPMLAPRRPLPDLGAGRGGLVAGVYRALAAPSQPLLTWASELSAVQRLVTTPLTLLTHLDDADFLAQVEAVEALTSQVVAYSGRAFGQVYHRFLTGNALAGGQMEIAGRTVSLSAVTAPVLVLAGATDTIAPVPAVKAVIDLLTGSAQTQLEIVPGGHLGMLTGRGARTSTWDALDDWLTQYSTPDAPAAPVPAKKSAAEKAPARTSNAKKAAAKKAPARKAPAKKTAAKRSTGSRTRPDATPAPGGIGTNPERRYGSEGARGLAP